MEEHPLRTFTPVAYYDKYMDCIRVEIRDCSVTETRVNGLITILEDNYPEDGQSQYVGFVIKGISHLFKKLDLPLDGVHKVTDLLNRIVTECPEALMGVALAQFDRLLKDTELQVDFAEAA